MSEIERGPHGYCLECEAKIEAAVNMECVLLCTKCTRMRFPTPMEPQVFHRVRKSESEQTYVVEYSGGYWSEAQGRVRHITDAQLYSLKELAQEVIDELDSDSCAIKPVWIRWETDR